MIPHCAKCTRTAAQVPIFWRRATNDNICHECLLETRERAARVPINRRGYTLVEMKKWG